LLCVKLIICYSQFYDLFVNVLFCVARVEEKYKEMEPVTTGEEHSDYLIEIQKFQSETLPVPIFYDVLNFGIEVTLENLRSKFFPLFFVLLDEEYFNISSIMYYPILFLFSF